MISKLKEKFSNPAKALAVSLPLLFGSAANANDNMPASFTPDANLNYVQNCVSGNCASTHGSRWSSANPNGVAVSVSMGLQPLTSDDRIQQVLTKGLELHGVENIKFFFEQNDASASLISFHVRGGTEGPHRVSGKIKQVVEEVARYAKTDDPVLLAGYE